MTLISDGHQANSLPQTFKRDIRPLRYINTTAERIPPFACMQTLTQRKDGAEVLWDVSKPQVTINSQINELNAHRQAFKFIFNLGRACPPKGRAEGTEDYPCQALYRPLNPTKQFPFGSTDGSTPSLTSGNVFGSGSKCGPAAFTSGAGSSTSATATPEWWLLPSTDHFVCKSVDMSSPIIAGGLRTIWVVPNSWQSQEAYGTATIPNGSPPLASLKAVVLVNGGQRNITYAFRQVQGSSTPVVLVNKNGIYQFNFSATVSSTTAPRGAPLVLQAQQYSPETISTYFGWPNLGVGGFRLQDIEQDVYYLDDFYTAENIAFSGLWELRSGQGILIRNLSQYSLVLQSVFFNIVKVAEHPEGG